MMPSNETETGAAPPEQNRVFITVLLPGDQVRQYQLQPKVKLANVGRSLRLQGSLFLGDRKIMDHESPNDLGLLCGVENCTELVFVPTNTSTASSGSRPASLSPPRVYVPRGTDAHTQEQSASYDSLQQVHTAAVLPQNSTFDATSQKSYLSGTPSIYAAPSTSVVDVEALLQYARARASGGGVVVAPHAPQMTSSSSSAHNGYPPATTSGASWIASGPQPSVPNTSTMYAIPSGSAFNPHANLMHREAAAHADSRASIEPSLQDDALLQSSNHKLPSLNPKTTTNGDRPCRKALPLERRHGDTVVAHTPWPLDSFTFAQLTPARDHHQYTSSDKEQESSYNAPVTQSSPKLQGTKKRPQPSGETELSTTQQQRSSNQQRQAEEMTLSRTSSVTTETPPPPALLVSSDASQHAQQLPEVVVQRFISTEEATRILTERLEDVTLGVSRLAQELQIERDRRMTLERRVEWLSSMLPDEIVKRGAELEHQRLMQELREQRQRSKSGSSVIPN